MNNKKEESKSIARTTIPVTVSEYLETNNLEYMIYSSLARAIPLVTSGLKLGAQRLIYSMYKDGLTPTADPVKSIKVTASTTASFHPHGQSGAYDTLVSLAAPYSRAQLVDGIGSFGSYRGEMAAADRYTEARLSELGYSLVKEVSQGAVPMRPNYDNKTVEPEYLPISVPILLCTGAFGISEGWSTTFPSHNPREVVDVTLERLKNPHMTVDDVLAIMPGPDWGTGGTIIGDTSGIKQYYETGKGSLTVRGRLEFEKNKIIIKDLPPEASMPTLLDGKGSLKYGKGSSKSFGLRDKVRSGIIEGVSDVSELSDYQGNTVEIPLKRGAKPEEVARSIFKETDLEATYSPNCVAADRNYVLRTWGILDVIDEFIALRHEVIINRSQYAIDKIDEQLWKLNALAVVALDKERAMRIIFDSEDKEEAKKNIFSSFDISEEQAEYIIDLPLHRLTKADAIAVKGKIESLNKEKAPYQKLIDSPASRKRTIIKELKQSRKMFEGEKFDRRTSIEPHISPTSSSEVELSDIEKLAYWKFDEETFSIGTKGKELSKHESIYVAFSNGKIKKFSGKGLPKNITDKLLAPNLEDVYFCGTYEPDKHDLIFITAGKNKSSSVKVLRVNTRNMNDQGLAGRGVAGIKLMPGDEIIGVYPATEDDNVFTASDGSWKLTPVKDIPIKGLGTQGVGVHTLTKNDSFINQVIVTNKNVVVNGKEARPTPRSSSPKRMKISSVEIVSPKKLAEDNKP